MGPKQTVLAKNRYDLRELNNPISVKFVNTGEGLLVYYGNFQPVVLSVDAGIEIALSAVHNEIIQVEIIHSTEDGKK